MIICLWAAGWTIGERESAAGRLLGAVPRLALGTEVIWADARGLPLDRLPDRLSELAATPGRQMQTGVAAVPLVAEVAARVARAGTAHIVAAGEERAFMATCPLSLLRIPDSWSLLLQGVGLETCADLGVLEREAVEVRLGPELVALWRSARGEDARQLFRRVPPEPLHASIDFIDYEVTDPERLIFSVNSLFGGICTELNSQGTHARRMTLTLFLAGGEKWERVLRPARPTGNRTIWLRLARAVLERITVSAAVVGLTIVVEGVEAASAVQGDLFDPGFASSSAVTAALERMIEAQGEVIVEMESSQHGLAEQRSQPMRRFSIEQADSGVGSTAEEQQRHSPSQDVRFAGPVGLTLQLLPEPREVLVETVRQRDHQVPIRYRDRQWKQLVTAAGPDRISGGRWGESYAREYFRAVTVDGTLVWLYRDARSDHWFLHGWWD